MGGKALVAALLMVLAGFLLRALSIFIILSVALLVYAGMATLLGTIPRENLQKLYKAIMHKNERGLSEVRASIADENIYTQFIERLPIVKAGGEESST